MQARRLFDARAAAAAGVQPEAVEDGAGGGVPLDDVADRQGAVQFGGGGAGSHDGCLFR